MKRSFRWMCSKADMDGVPSRYYPRFRPRRLVMPVDTNDVHSSKRHGNPLQAKSKELRRLQRSSERRGSITLATVPAERSVGDAVRLMLEACEAASLLRFAAPSSSSSSLSLSPHLEPLYALLTRYGPQFSLLQSSGSTGKEGSAARIVKSPNPRDEEHSSVVSSLPSVSHTSAIHDVALSGELRAEKDSRLIAALHKPDSPSHLAIRWVDDLWEHLDRTPLSSPAHGALALKGKAIVEAVLLSALYRQHPRLRSRHAQQFLHECCGLLPCGRIALRLGLAGLSNAEAEVNMWRELNILTLRYEEARRRAAQHRERAEKGVTAERRWYWRSVLKSAAGRLRLFPVQKEDLQPRMEWLRQQLFVFVAFLDAVQQSSMNSHINKDGEEDTVDVEHTVLALFSPALLRFTRDQEVLHTSARILREWRARNDATTNSISNHNNGDTNHTNEKRNEAESPPVRKEMAETASAAEQQNLSLPPLQQAVRHLERVYERVLSMDRDEKVVLNSRYHPLNEAADRRREQFESSGGAHAMETLRDDQEEEHLHSPAYDGIAAPPVVHSTRVQNALKEAQLILQYSPLVHPRVRHSGGINVEQVIRRTVELHETNPYATLTTGRQQFRPVEYRVCRLYSGPYCLGEGKGESLVEATQRAAQQMVSNYYLQRGAFHVSEETHGDEERSGRSASSSSSFASPSPSNTTGDDAEAEREADVRPVDPSSLAGYQNPLPRQGQENRIADSHSTSTDVYDMQYGALHAIEEEQNDKSEDLTAIHRDARGAGVEDLFNDIQSGSDGDAATSVAVSFSPAVVEEEVQF